MPQETEQTPYFICLLFMRFIFYLSFLLTWPLSAQQSRFQFSIEIATPLYVHQLKPNAVPMADGGYAITSVVQRNIPYSIPAQSGEFPVFIRFDHAGNPIKVHQFNRHAPNAADIGDLTGTSDGGFMLATSTSDSTVPSLYLSNATLVKLDAMGAVVWKKAYRPDVFNGASFFSAVKQLPDGGYIACGTVYNLATTYNSFLMRTDSLGNPLWIKLYATASYDIMFDLELMPDGGYVMACHGGPVLNQFNALVLRTDSLGTVNWVKQLDTPNSIDVAFGVSVCANGDVLMTGLTQDLQFYQTDLIAARFDDFGNVLWCRSYTLPGLPHSGINIDELYDGTIAIGVDASLLTPQFQSTYYQAIGLMRLSSNGDLLAMQILSDTASGGSIQQSGKGNDGGIWVLGNRFEITPANGVIASYPTLIKTDTSLQSGCPQFNSELTERVYNYSLYSSINQTTRSVNWYVPVYDTLPLSLAKDTVLCLEKIPRQEPVLVMVEPLSIPNVFTPNADGINDLFLPTGDAIGNYRLLIYNRWGNLIAELENTGWNGRNKQGADVVDGTYYYVFEFGAQRYTGFFNLAR